MNLKMAPLLVTTGWVESFAKCFAKVDLMSDLGINFPT